jgi:hypothetical protein
VKQPAIGGSILLVALPYAPKPQSQDWGGDALLLHLRTLVCGVLHTAWASGSDSSSVLKSNAFGTSNATLAL